MHFYQFNIKDYRAKTAHLLPIEHYIYRSLIDWYYLNQKPFECDIVKIARVLMLRAEEELQALKNVLAEFFVVKKLKATGDKTECYHHARIDAELKAYKNRSKSTSNGTSELQGDTSESTSKVQADDTPSNDTNAKKSNMARALREKGIKASTRLSVSKLQALFDTHCKQSTSELQGDTSESTSTTSAVSSSYNHKPLTSNQEPLTSESENATHPPSQNQTAKQKAELSTPTAKKTKFDPKAYPIGDSVDPDLWADFCDMRKAIKKPLTEFACKQLVKDFNDWADEGLSPNRAIAESIKNSWQGVFRDRAIIKPVNPTLANQKPNRIEELGQLSQSVDWGNFYGNNQTFANPQPTLVGEQ